MSRAGQGHASAGRDVGGNGGQLTALCLSVPLAAAARGSAWLAPGPWRALLDPSSRWRGIISGVVGVYVEPEQIRPRGADEVPSTWPMIHHPSARSRDDQVGVYVEPMKFHTVLKSSVSKMSAASFASPYSFGL